jgi:hypothetical protein
MICRPTLLSSVPMTAGLLALVASAGRPPRSHQQDPLSMSWRPEVEIPVGSGAGDLRTEPSVVIADSVIVAAWNDSYGGAHGSQTGVAIGWAISYDSGATFSFGGYLPAPDSTDAPSGADSWLAREPDGRIYLQLLTWQRDYQEIRVYSMPASRRGSWERSVSAIRARMLDKPSMTVAAGGRIAMVYTSGDSIGFTRSVDRGRHWSQPHRLSAEVPGRLRTGAAVAWCGESLVAAWMEGSTAGLRELWIATSRDAGNAFSRPKLLYRLNRPVAPPSGYALGVGPAGFISNNAWLACRPSDVLRQPVFYIAAAEGGHAGSSILLLQGPIDRIVATPLAVNAPLESPTKVFPAVAVVGDLPAVLYYDRRLSPGTSLTDVFLSIQDPNGGFADFRVTTRPTDWQQVAGDRALAPVQRNFGDYIFLAAEGDRLVAAWTDGRTGRPRIMTRAGRVGR